MSRGALRFTDAQLAAYNAKRNPFTSVTDKSGQDQRPPEDSSRPLLPARGAPLTAATPSQLSAGHSQECAGGPAAPSKYRNKPTNGYASKREAKRAAELKLMQEAGQIRNLREQVSYLLIPKQDGERACSYVADFVYQEWTKLEPQVCVYRTVVEDCKGMKTDVYKIKKKLMLMVHGIRIRET